MMQLHGSMVALITPFTPKGRIDVRRVERLVRWHIEEGTEGIVCVGSTGEALSLTDRDRSTMIKSCVEAAEKKVPIIAGTGTADTMQSIRFTEAAHRLGVDACMIVMPYYNKPTQKGCLRHVQEIARSEVPLIIYNNPGRCVVGLEPETMAEMAQVSNVIAFKETNANPVHFSKLRTLTSLPIFAGEDTKTYELLREGAVGAISVIGNLFPRLWGEMIRSARTGAWEQAKEHFDRLQPLLTSLSLEPNPQCVKKALSLMGRCRAKMRLPLLEPTEQVTLQLKKALIQLSIPFWLSKSKLSPN